MSANIICLTAGGGLPIFSRHKGNGATLPFPVIGSLNGVQLFSKSQQIELLNCKNDDYIVVWKEFYDSINLIGVSSNCTEAVVTKVLESAFNAMVLIVGIEEIKAQRNVERLKRELRVCYPLVDRLMDSLDYGDASNKNPSHLVQMPELILCPENHLIQILLDSYTECVDSVYSCVLIHGKLAAATEDWWSLHPEELKLLSLLATIENTSSSKDIPVYLPFKSPTIAFRFVCCTLIPDVQVCCLCGPTPALDAIEHSATQCFKSAMEILGSAVLCHPRNFAPGILLDNSILGVLLINIPKRKYMISRNPNQSSKRISNTSYRFDILRTFFYQAILGSLLPLEFVDLDQNDKNKKNNNPIVGGQNIPKETYWCSEYHKCHGMKIEENILCALYTSAVPVHTMRQITKKTMKNLLQDKLICW